VLGSGCCPAWMALVPNFMGYLFLGFLKWMGFLFYKKNAAE